MKIFFKGLCTLISLFLLIASSCKNPEDLGLEVQPNNIPLGAIITDTVSMLTYIQTEDTILTNVLSRTAIGTFMDMAVGSTTAEAALQPYLSVNALALGRDSLIDSMVLQLAYSDFYGDSNSTFELTVYRLDSGQLKPNTDYNQFQNFNYGSTEVGKLTFKPQPKTQVTYTNVIGGANDTVITQYPQLRVTLYKAFAEELFYAGKDKYASRDAFKNLLGGLYIKCKATSGVGGIMHFDNSSSRKSNLVYYYSNTVNSLKNTTSQLFPVDFGSVRATKITHTYNADIANKLTDTISNQSTVYVKALAGLQTILKFPNIDSLKDKSVARATITIPVLSNDFAPVPTLTLYYKNNLGTYSTFSAAILNAAKTEYIADLSLNLQGVINGKIPNKIFIKGYNTATNSLFSARSIIGGAKGATPVKLRLIYTKL